MKRFSAALLLALYASSTPASTLPSTVTTTTTTIPGNSSLLDDVIEATNARNNLKVVPTSQIGSTLVTQAELSTTAALSGFTMGAAGIAGLAYYQRTGKDPVYAAAASIASGADALFQPAYQAFKATFVSPESFPASAAQYIGKEGSVGATLQDVINYVKGSSGSNLTSLKSLIDTNTVISPTVTSELIANAVITASGNNYRLTSSASTSGGSWATPTQFTNTMNAIGAVPISGFSNLYLQVAALKLWYQDMSVSINNSYGTKDYRYSSVSVVSTTNPSTISPNTGINFLNLKNALNSANIDAGVANDIRSALANVPTSQKITSSDAAPTSLPSSVPSPITNNDISNFFTANTTNIYNEYLNTVNNGGDVNTAQAAAELAKAQEEEAEKETEEKFNALDANPFQNPYNPGPFDIPTRFTTFLGNVKSSGLFSFSSAFFDSLPGGGSPVYTVEAGNYGTHTIDLSDTMSTGLAVLKSILLACFGFLSIRAVIMKR